MIITLITIGLLVAGIILFIVYNNTNCGEWIFGASIFSIVASVIIGFFVAVIIIDTHAGSYIKYQNKLYEKKVLEYRINNMEDNIVGNEMIYNDIVEFNNELRSIKKWANNPWTNWFYNKDIATIDYIEFME